MNSLSSTVDWILAVSINMKSNNQVLTSNTQICYGYNYDDIGFITFKINISEKILLLKQHTNQFIYGR